jgi:phosphatidylserine/phosphatidylglycerophosphate/cardiolipin synthase-like enzyme
MKINKLRLLYGKEFWQELEELIKNSQERVFVISAYVNKDSYLWLQSLIPKNVFSLLLCREDSGYIPDCALTVSKNSLHGKLYLVDDAIIIGSQNLANFGKEGELIFD